MALIYRERPAAGEPDGLLVLHHGRGADELDLLPLAEALDPRRRLHVVAPRAPLAQPGMPGWHWYIVPEVGRPDPQSFAAACAQLGELHDELWERTATTPGRTVLGGFSMGAVMSYALALPATRPAVAGVLAFSGFLPSVEGWQPDLGSRSRLRAFVAHGDADPVIAASLGRAAADFLRAGAIAVDYREGTGGHEIEPPALAAAAAWLEVTLPPLPRDQSLTRSSSGSP
jgi:phospholipase/carboxylesterase